MIKDSWFNTNHYNIPEDVSFMINDMDEKDAEIQRLRNELHLASTWAAKVYAGREEDAAEIERLVKSRNRWGQKYNKLLDKHKVTQAQLKSAVFSDSEECKLLTEDNERLRAALEQVHARINEGHYEAAFAVARAALTEAPQGRIDTAQPAAPGGDK
jgi:septal ring factor EnvC (AmiA/AmiB activator)